MLSAAVLEFSYVYSLTAVIFCCDRSSKPASRSLPAYVPARARTQSFDAARERTDSFDAARARTDSFDASHSGSNMAKRNFESGASFPNHDSEIFKQELSASTLASGERLAQVSRSDPAVALGHGNSLETLVALTPTQERSSCSVAQFSPYSHLQNSIKQQTA